MCTEIKKNKIKKISVHTVSAENYNCFSLYKSLRLLGYFKMKLFDQASDMFFFVIFVNAHVFHLRSIFLKK